MSDGTYVFSVIVPFLNEAAYIEDCLKALTTQDFSTNQYEIIFVDNGSQDGSLEIAKQYPQVKIVLEAEPHVYRARNKGVSAASGKYLAFTDADCVPSKNWLSSILSEFQKSNNTAGVIGCNSFNVAYGEPKSLKMIEFYEQMKDEYVYQHLDERFRYGHTNNFSILRDAFLQLDGFSTTFKVTGDTDLVQRLIQQCSIESVVYSKVSKVRHLEIKSVSDWIEKLKLYRIEHSMNATSTGFMMLGWKERFEVIRYSCWNLYKKDRKCLFIFVPVLLWAFILYCFKIVQMTEGDLGGEE